jgi:hypothetical protein
MIIRAVSKHLAASGGRGHEIRSRDPVEYICEGLKDTIKGKQRKRPVSNSGQTPLSTSSSRSTPGGEMDRREHAFLSGNP